MPIKNLLDAKAFGYTEAFTRWEDAFRYFFNIDDTDITYLDALMEVTEEQLREVIILATKEEQ